MIKINFNQILSSTKKTVINAGFTLIELMVVIAIFTLITTIALFDQGKMNSNVLLTNLAYDIALSVRQAQSYGIGVKYSDPVPSGIDGGYGIYVTKSKPDTLIIFHDVDGSGGYDPTYDGLPEKEYVFSNQRGNSIKFLCAQQSTSSGTCKADTLVNSISAVYVRPNPEPIFKSDAGTFGGPAYIVIKSSDNALCRAIVIEPSGQIRVEGSESYGCKNT